MGGIRENEEIEKQEKKGRGRGGESKRKDIKKKKPNYYKEIDRHVII